MEAKSSWATLSKHKTAIRMRVVIIFTLTALAFLDWASAYSPDGRGGRRAFLSAAAKSTAAAVSVSLPRRAFADDGELEQVYFGAGCFWHVQHEFILAERNILNRKDSELTSLTGYAGGTQADKEGRVCYHNFNSIADYGKMGHGEVVVSVVDCKCVQALLY